MIEVKNLTKKFKAPSEEKGIFGFKKKDFWAVKDLNFNIKQGSVASILGPNGCGKTTTLRMIAGMLTPSKGTAFVDSIDVRKDKQTVKSKIGYMTNNTSLYDRLNVLETIKFFAELNQIPEEIYMPRAEKLFKRAGFPCIMCCHIADGNYHCVIPFNDDNEEELHKLEHELVWVNHTR